MISNVGILHETLVTRCAQAITDNRAKTAASAIRLSKRFFAINKPLNTELRLHLTLSRPNNLTEQAATDLIRIAREEAKKADSKLIAEQVTKITKIIANALQHEPIKVNQETYDRHVLVGKLLSAWRKNSSIDKIASLESAVVKSMCAPARQSNASSDVNMSNQPTALLNKMMTLRMSEAYGDKLSDEHNSVLVAAIKDDRKFLLERASSARDNLRAQTSAASDLSSETKKVLSELAEKLDHAVKDLKTIDDKFVAQLLACIDVEKEFLKTK